MAGKTVLFSLAALALLAAVAALLLGTGAIRASGLEPWAGDSSGSELPASSAAQAIDPRLILMPRTVTQAATAAGVRMDLTTGPLLPGTNRFALSLTEQGRPLSAAHVTLEARMDGMPMQPVSLPMREVQPGQYAVTGPPTMFGPWQIAMRIDRPGTATVTHQFMVSIDLPRGLLAAPATAGASQQAGIAAREPPKEAQW